MALNYSMNSTGYFEVDIIVFLPTINYLIVLLGSELKLGVWPYAPTRVQWKGVSSRHLHLYEQFDLSQHVAAAL